MRFVVVDNIPGSTTPARVYRSTGVVLINKSRFDNLPDFTKKFILKHEEGHYKLNTSNEYLADEYASNALLLSEPGSLKKSIEALDKVLPKTTPEQRARITEQIKRALKTDAAIGNKEAAEALKNLIDMQNNFEGTIISPENAKYEMNAYFPSVGKSFNDVVKSKLESRDAFLDRSQLEATGFTRPTFIKSIGESDNSAPVYESGKVILTEKLPETVKEVIKTASEQTIDADIFENPAMQEKNIQVRVSNPLFYFMLGVITVLVLALIVNIFKK
jgi:hypothetical protein